VAKRFKIVRFNGAAVLQQKITVSFFLPWEGLDDEHWAAACQGL